MLSTDPTVLYRTLKKSKTSGGGKQREKKVIRLRFARRVQVCGHGVHHGNIIPVCQAVSFFIFESMGDINVMRFLALP